MLDTPTRARPKHNATSPWLRNGASGPPGSPWGRPDDTPAIGPDEQASPAEPARAAPAAGKKLSAALRETAEHRWAGMRSEKRNITQAGIAVKAISEALGGDDPDVSEVPKETLKAIVRQWRSDGAATATMLLRLNCLSAMGVDVKGCRPRVQRKLKWWLKPEEEVKIVAWLRSIVAPVEVRAWLDYRGKTHFGDRPNQLANLIIWTTRTGLRIEESLRATWGDVTRTTVMVEGVKTERVSLTVQGLKTWMAQASLVLSKEAVEVLDGLPKGSPGSALFDIPYPSASVLWSQARLAVLDLPDPKVATLKALRRSAARNLHAIKGMPLDMVRTYLRHENVQTTMGYLRLTGGYNEEEMAGWL